MENRKRYPAFSKRRCHQSSRGVTNSLTIFMSKFCKPTSSQQKCLCIMDTSNAHAQCFFSKYPRTFSTLCLCWGKDHSEVSTNSLTKEGTTQWRHSMTKLKPSEECLPISTKSSSSPVWPTRSEWVPRWLTSWATISWSPKTKCSFAWRNASRTFPTPINKMHEVGLVHLDIKVENIAFSRTQNRFVFIDFGLSRLIAQKRGHKTLTQFVGTLSYCSPEMRKCYILQDRL